jgi:DNA mismatch repair protein MutS2
MTASANRIKKLMREPLANTVGAETEVPAPVDLQQSAQQLLEFPRVRQMLAERTRFFRSRELADSVEPQSHIEDVLRLQAETAEAVLMLHTAGDIGLTGHQDLRPILRRAALGGMLTGQEIMSFVYLLDSTWVARNVVVSMDDRTPLMGAIAADIPDLSFFKNEAIAALTDTGDVRDSATPRLGKLRIDAARAYQKLVRILERLASSPDVRSALQSPNIASRGDRLVLEVRTDSREVVPGIVHDVSNTGVTLFVEPFRAVDPCNEWREAAAEAQREEERVLRELSGIIGDNEDQATAAIEAAADLDLITARARLSLSMRARRPETLEYGTSTAVRLLQARHPLLGDHVVPTSLNIGPRFRGLVVTGPNTGGKTVALKTIGLLALMHQCGMQLPTADGTALSVFSAVFADIGDAQSIDRSVSTFSSHMGRVIDILRQADENSIVLLDELGTGTDPEEGSALARAVLANLVDRNIPVAVTTHHRAVAEFAGDHERLENASVELDANTLRPTYRFIMGVPGRSYAIHVARNLGLPELVLEHATSMLDPSRAVAESLLNQIQRERDAVSEALEKAQKDSMAAESARKELENRLRQVAKQQEDLVYKTQSELRREADNVRRQLKRIAAQAESGKSLAAAQRAVNRLSDNLVKRTWMPLAAPEPIPGKGKGEVTEERPLAAGDEVEIKGLNVRAKVIAVKKNGTTDLQMGNARIQLNSEQLRRVEPEKPAGSEPRSANVKVSRTRATPVTSELDVRGKRVANIEELLTAFVDDCAADDRDSCRIIHGSGTGALRQAVREVLSRMPQVTSFEPAERAAGGDGVTVAKLR